MERFWRGSGYTISLSPLCAVDMIAYVFENGLHESDSGFGRLDKLVFGLLNVESGCQLRFRC